MGGKISSNNGQFIGAILTGGTWYFLGSLTNGTNNHIGFTVNSKVLATNDINKSSFRINPYVLEYDVLSQQNPMRVITMQSTTAFNPAIVNAQFSQPDLRVYMDLNVDHWQSFTATSTGFATSYGVYAGSDYYDAYGIGQYYLYSGQGTGGTLLNSGQTVTIGYGPSWRNVNISQPYPQLVNGQKYTIRLKCYFTNPPHESFYWYYANSGYSGGISDLGVSFNFTVSTVTSNGIEVYGFTPNDATASTTYVNIDACNITIPWTNAGTGALPNTNTYSVVLDTDVLSPNTTIQHGQLQLYDTTDTTAVSTGSCQMLGGCSIAKSLWLGQNSYYGVGSLNITGAGPLNNLVLPNATIIYLTGTITSNVHLTGFFGARINGQLITIIGYYASGANVYIDNNSSSSAAANRIYTNTGADVLLTLNPIGTAQFIYNTTLLRWLLINMVP